MTDDLTQAKRHIANLLDQLQERMKHGGFDCSSDADVRKAAQDFVDRQGQTVSLRNLSVLEAMEKQFGPSPDGALERDIASVREGQTVEGGDPAFEAALERVIAERMPELTRLKSDLAKRTQDCDLLTEEIAALRADCERLSADHRTARNAAYEMAARIVDGFTCGLCGMDGKAGHAIRSLKDQTEGSGA